MCDAVPTSRDVGYKYIAVSDGWGLSLKGTKIVAWGETLRTGAETRSLPVGEQQTNNCSSLSGTDLFWDLGRRVTLCSHYAIKFVTFGDRRRKNAMKPQFFRTQDDFRDWLEENHDSRTELLVGFWKTGSGKASMTWSESVDQALCFGWIDGVRKRVDDDSYTIRFTPRRPTSIWSKINIEKVAVLLEKGLMHPAGIEAFDKRKDDRSRIYAYENTPKVLDAELVREFKRDKAAWKFFEALPPSFHKLMIYWVMSAKQEKTRRTRFEKLVAASREGKRL